MNTITPLFGTALPIIQAPMASVQGSRLAAAVCGAGGLGSLRATTDRPYNVNFFCHTPPEPDAAREAAWRAVVVAVHRHARTVVQEEGLLDARAHLRTTGVAVAAVARRSIGIGVSNLPRQGSALGPVPAGRRQQSWRPEVLGLGASNTALYRFHWSCAAPAPLTWHCRGLNPGVGLTLMPTTSCRLGARLHSAYLAAVRLCGCAAVQPCGCAAQLARCSSGSRAGVLGGGCGSSPW
jgi:hypothetical protein